MNNREYRKYIHDMYFNNFFSLGKKPKALQIFGDSYGHFSDEETWIGIVAKELDIPVLNYSYVGAPNLRTFSFFANYYNEDCLNIFLITSSNRVYINDDMFIVSGATPEQTVMVCAGKKMLSSENFNSYKELGHRYLERIFNPDIEYIRDAYMLERIFYKKNTIFIHCFGQKNFFSDEYKNLSNTYNFVVPQLLGISFWDVSVIQFLDETDKDFLISDEVKPDYNPVGSSRYLEYFNLKPTKDHGTDCKNHMSKETQKSIAKIFLDILRTGEFKEKYSSFKRPAVEEILTHNCSIKETSLRTKNFLKFGKLEPRHTHYLAL